MIFADSMGFRLRLERREVSVDAGEKAGLAARRGLIARFAKLDDPYLRALLVDETYFTGADSIIDSKPVSNCSAPSDSNHTKTKPPEE